MSFYPLGSLFIAPFLRFCLCAPLGAAHTLTGSAQGAQTLSLVVHSGTLCKANMAASCARTLTKVGLSFLESPAARRSGAFSYLLGNVGAHGSRRAYGTGGAGFRSKLLSGVRQGGGRVLGCAFLLGGGLGLYQTVKLSVQQHLAKEERKVSEVSGCLWSSPSACSKLTCLRCVQPGSLVRSQRLRTSATSSEYCLLLCFYWSRNTIKAFKMRCCLVLKLSLQICL